MKLTHLVFGIGLSATLLPMSGIASTPAAVEFSADTHQSAPQRGERSGKIYVSTRYVRTEMQQSGQKVVRIVDSETSSSWVIYPQHKSYIEYKGAKKPGDLKADQGNPCYGLEKATCTILGDEKVNGRLATKWSVEMAGPKGNVKTTHWIDKQRSILLRQATNQSTLMEQKLLGSEKLQNRSVEKWQMTVTQPGKQPQQSVRWFDLQLNLAIREEYPGGYVRELRNIKVGAQPASLFAVPKGYKQIQPQQTQSPQRR